MAASRRLRELQSQPGNKICVDRTRVFPQQVIESDRALEEIWSLKVERSKRERATSDEKLEEKRVWVNLLKEEGNHRFLVGEIDEAVLKYTEAIEFCPLRYTNGRIVLYSNRAQCNLLLRDSDAAISDATRALCLSSPPEFSFQKPMENMTGMT
ncbi:ARM-repeat/Tetratricopeptide repeat (TPR)-like protein [Abeliophyllum distichum]|uniref:ARM-repeat/Tetratricopeptide repeat (TPR)-like protein n=1 Tax=Abeliophyllum distichum TaxID=126358 RepID=A0ABD1T120_9LAMI